MHFAALLLDYDCHLIVNRYDYTNRACARCLAVPSLLTLTLMSLDHEVTTVAPHADP